MAGIEKEERVVPLACKSIFLSFDPS